MGTNYLNYFKNCIRTRYVLGHCLREYVMVAGGRWLKHNVRRYVALASRCIGTVARVFALVVRCRVMRLFLYYRVGKNRDTRRESPDGTVRGRPHRRPLNVPL